MGGGLRMLLPLAVWSDGNRTFPRVPLVELPPPGHAVGDVPVRLAAVVTVWSTLLWFYPYFGDRPGDWTTLLPNALNEAAGASSLEEAHAALSRLVAALHDDHTHVRHPTH